MDAGIIEADVHFYTESIRRGESMVTVRTDEMRRGSAGAVLDRHSTVSLANRRANYESEGWDGYDEGNGCYPSQERSDPPRGGPSPIL